MTHAQNKNCKRCGNCCRRMLWIKKYSFEEVTKIIQTVTSKRCIEDNLILHYKRYLKRKGLPTEGTDSIEWDKKNQTITVCIKTGRCKHLSFKDGRAICFIYKRRPEECRDYLCKKVRQKIAMKKIKEREKVASYVTKYVEPTEIQSEVEVL